MEFDATINIGTIITSGIFGVLVYQVRTLSNLVTEVRLHDWRLKELEDKKQCNKSHG